MKDSSESNVTIGHSGSKETPEFSKMGSLGCNIDQFFSGESMFSYRVDADNETESYQRWDDYVSWVEFDWF